MTFSPLERLGLEVAAYQLTGSRMTAAILVALVLGDGKLVTFDTLAAAKQYRAVVEPASRKAVQMKICWLREALEDLGVPNAIETDGSYRGGVPKGQVRGSAGYYLREPARSAVIERLVEVAS